MVLVSGLVRVVSLVVAVSMTAVSRGVTVEDGPDVARGDVAQAAVKATVMMVTIESRRIESPVEVSTPSGRGVRGKLPATGARG